MSEQTVDRGDDLEVKAAEETGAEEAQGVKVETSESEAKEGAKAESEAKEDAKGEPEAKENDPPRDESGRFIPVSRHKQVLDNERAARESAERELAALKKQIAQVDRNADIDKIELEIKGLEKEHAKSVLDGDVDKAAELAGQIRVKERAIQIASNVNVPEKIKEEMREELRWESTVERLEAAYPMLKPGSEEYDQDIVDMVLATQQSNVHNKHMTPSAALLSAAEKIMAKLMPPSRDEGKREGLEAGKGTQDREKRQTQKNLETLKKQPPDLTDAGLDSDKAGMTKDIDVRKLTSEEFANLPESTKARLRGDLL